MSLIHPPLADSRSRIASSRQSAPAADPLVVGDWRLGRQLAQTGYFCLHQAQPRGAPTAAPFDYVVKAPRDSTQLGLATAMLRREAQVARQVGHEHLMTILDDRSADATPHLVFPYLPGATLQSRILAAANSGRQLSLSAAIWAVRQAAGALAALHRRGWLHGDLQPGNLLIAPSGHVTLCDLGLARRLDTSECSSAGVWAGSPHFAAPEMWLPREPLTAAADLYSLGAVLFAALTGAPPFAAESETALALQHLRTACPALHERRGDVSPGLERLVRTMLAKEPLRRPDSSVVVEQLTRLEIESLSRRC